MRPTFWPAPHVRLVFSALGLGLALAVIPATQAGCQLVMEPLPEPVDDEQLGGRTGGGGALGAGGALAPGGRAGNESGGRNAACPVPCDCDEDGDRDRDCGGGDCDDTDGDVHRGQTRYFDVASGNVGFDYDCSDTLDRDPALNLRADCSLFSIATCDAVTQGYTGVVPECGQSAAWGTCKRGTLACEPDPRGSQVMRCR